MTAIRDLMAYYAANPSRMTSGENVAHDIEAAIATDGAKVERYKAEIEDLRTEYRSAIETIRIREDDIDELTAKAERYEAALRACWDEYEELMPDALYDQVREVLGIRVFRAAIAADTPPGDRGGKLGHGYCRYGHDILTRARCRYGHAQPTESEERS